MRRCLTQRGEVVPLGYRECDRRMLTAPPPTNLAHLLIYQQMNFQVYTETLSDAVAIILAKQSKIHAFLSPPTTPDENIC